MRKSALICMSFFAVSRVFSGSAFAKATDASADAASVHYAPAGAWVAPPPESTNAETASGSPYRVIYSDTQVRITADWVETHSAFRVKLLSSSALALGALRLEWNPASQAVAVNGLKVYRDGQVIDVLAANKFSVLQREANLEASMLTGTLTATLQIPGLQVGDEIEFENTIRDRDIVFGNHVYGADLMMLAEGPGANRVSLSWDGQRVPHYQATEDLPEPRLENQKVVWTFNDPAKIQLSEGAPARFNLRRLIEYSDFTDWRQVSAAVYPLFAKAGNIPAGSKIDTEIDEIAKATTDPLLRAGAALKFVQEQIRYVFVGLNGANYRPTDIATTWQNRFGDCKAKSVMLQAMLQKLGINSEIVLVQGEGGEIIPSRLPTPLFFNHAVVKASIDGHTYFLDATENGDRVLSLLEPTRYLAVLPLREGGADLERPAAKAPIRPSLVATADVDWRGGLDKPGKVKATRYILGEEGALYHAQLAALSPEQADRGLRAFWAQQDSWIIPDTVSWRYDESRSATIISITGTADPDWSVDERGAHSDVTPYAGSYPPPERKRPDGQDAKAPWVNDVRTYRCFVANIHLPAPTSPHFAWDYIATPYDTKIGGIHYVRRSSMEVGILRTVKVARVDDAEIDAAEAAKANSAIPGFDNSKGQMLESAPAKALAHTQLVGATKSPPLDLIDKVDWTQRKTPCTIE